MPVVATNNKGYGWLERIARTVGIEGLESLKIHEVQCRLNILDLAVAISPIVFVDGGFADGQFLSQTQHQVHAIFILDAKGLPPDPRFAGGLVVLEDTQHSVQARTHLFRRPVLGLADRAQRSLIRGPHRHFAIQLQPFAANFFAARDAASGPQQRRHFWMLVRTLQIRLKRYRPHDKSGRHAEQWMGIVGRANVGSDNSGRLPNVGFWFS